MYDFAERLKTLRKKLGLTQQALADNIGVTKAAISSMERGITNSPTPEHLFKLSRALHCDPLLLLKGEHNKAVQLSKRPKRQLSYLSHEEKKLLTYYSKLSLVQKKKLFSSLDQLTNEGDFV